MKVKDSLSNLIAEFAGMSKTPDFKPKLAEARPSSPKSHPHAERRHSLNIAVGVLEVPISPRRVRSDSLHAPEKHKIKYDTTLRRQSAPVAPTPDAVAMLKKKMETLRAKAHSDEEIREEEDEDKP